MDFRGDIHVAAQEFWANISSHLPNMCYPRLWILLLFIFGISVAALAILLHILYIYAQFKKNNH